MHCKLKFRFSEESGGPYLSGWINVFFPYLKNQASGGFKQNKSAQDWKSGIDSMFGQGG